MRTLLLLALIGGPIAGHATHLYGGELYVEAQTSTTYTVTLHLYINPSSPADRPEMPVDMGDGVVDTLPRISITPLQGGACSMELHIYSGSHTYAGPGTYVLSVTDSNRSDDLLNIPSSFDVPFCLQTLLVIEPMGGNNSVRFTALQNEVSFSFSTLVHALEAVDADGDSLSFELVEPLGNGCTGIPGYVMAGQVMPGTPLFWLDPTNGTLLWDHPQLIGRYNVTIRCSEWRNGQLVGQVTRDMTLCVGLVPTAIADPEAAWAPSVRTLGPDGLYQLDPAGTQALSVRDAQGRELQAHHHAGGLVDLSDRPAGVYVLHVQAPNAAPRMLRVLRP